MRVESRRRVMRVEYSYSCGHGKGIRYAEMSEKRAESYKEWAEKNKLCTDCWTQQKRAEERAQPLTSMLMMVDPNDYRTMAVCVVTGDSFGAKEALKGAGCRLYDVGKRKYWGLEVPTKDTKDNDTLHDSIRAKAQILADMGIAPSEESGLEGSYYSLWAHVMSKHKVDAKAPQLYQPSPEDFDLF